MTTFADTGQAHYTVHLRNCTGLSAEQQAAAELRFRMALEHGLGGRAHVLPSLQAYMLAQNLKEDLSPDDDAEAIGQMTAFWEKAENDAVLVAMKPLGDHFGDAQFEIIPG